MSQLPESIEIVSTDSAEFHEGVLAGKDAKSSRYDCPHFYSASKWDAWQHGFRVGRQDAANEKGEGKHK